MRFSVQCATRACAALFFAPAVLLAQHSQALTADQVKAGFIYNFTKYAEWPADNPTLEPATFHLCVIGESAVAGQLDAAVQGKPSGVRTIQVLHIMGDANLDDCELLYVGDITSQAEEKVLAAVLSQPILTVGSNPGFLRGEGIITFIVEGKRVRFDINLRAAARARIHFDSRVLDLARRRIEGPP